MSRILKAVVVSSPEMARKAALKKELSDRLFGFFGVATVSAAGYTVDLHRRLSQDRYLVVDVLVSGTIRKEWFRANDDGTPVYAEARFLLPVKGYKSRKKIICYSPTWGTVKAVVNHFANQFSDIEIINRIEE